MYLTFSIVETTNREIANNFFYLVFLTTGSEECGRSTNIIIMT